MTWFAPRRTLRSAQRELSTLSERLGMTTMSDWPPGLVAAVDQHAAAVRDILVHSGGRAGVVELACYARGVQDGAREHGWEEPGLLTSVSNWVSLRLAGTCSAAMAARTMAAMTSDEVDPLASL